MLQGFVAGLAAGALYGVLAVCLSTLYQLVKVVNLALVAIGVIGIDVASSMSEAGVQAGLAVLVAVAICGAISGLLGLVLVRWFSEAGADRKSALTIAVLLGLLGVAFVAFGTGARSFPLLVSGAAFSLGGVVVTNVAVACVAVGIAVVVALWAVMRFTMAGVRLAAISERPTTAELSGIRTTPIVLAVWVLAGAVTAPLLLLVAPSTPADPQTLVLLIVPICAAALVGSLRRAGVALLGGLVLGGIQGAMLQSSSLEPYQEVAPLVVIIAILLWNERREVWDVAR